MDAHIDTMEALKKHWGLGDPAFGVGVAYCAPVAGTQSFSMADLERKDRGFPRG